MEEITSHKFKKPNLRCPWWFKTALRIKVGPEGMPMAKSVPIAIGRKSEDFKSRTPHPALTIKQTTIKPNLRCPWWFKTAPRTKIGSGKSEVGSINRTPAPRTKPHLAPLYAYVVKKQKILRCPWWFKINSKQK